MLLSLVILKAYESIPEIIRDADYVGLHPNGDSLQYIKKIDGNVYVLVAVSLGVEEGSVRTMYSITENKLNNYLASGRLRKCDFFLTWSILDDIIILNKNRGNIKDGTGSRRALEV